MNELAKSNSPLIPKALLEAQPNGSFSLPPELVETLGGRSQREIYILMQDLSKENPNYHFSIADTYQIFGENGLPGPRTEFTITWSRK